MQILCGRFLLYPLFFLAVIYAGLIFLALRSDSILFQPPEPSYADRDFGRLGPVVVNGVTDVAETSTTPFQLIHFPSRYQRRAGLFRREDSAATLTAVYLPNPSARFTLLMSHGNAEDIGENLPLYAEYWRRGFSVFAYDYRGYGQSTGRPTEASTYADEHAAWLYLTRQLHVSPSRIILHGTSVGCGPAVWLAEALSNPKIRKSDDSEIAQPPAALILRSPFASAFTVLTRVPLLPWDKFPNASRIKSVRMPVLVVHGTGDEVIPFAHGQKVFRNAPPYGDQDAPLTRDGGKQHLWIPNAGHNNIFVVAPKMYFDKVQSFAEAIPK